MINNIEKFNKVYMTFTNADWSFLKTYQLSEDVLEYYVQNYNIGSLWDIIAVHQPLTNDFIIRYKDKLDWGAIIVNENITLTLPYDFFERNIYCFNLYGFTNSMGIETVRINNKVETIHRATFNKKYNAILNRLKDNYLEKYEIDKLSYHLRNNVKPI